MTERKNDTDIEIIRQSYDYTFLFDLLEIVRTQCRIINKDEKLSKLYSSLINYLSTRLPEIDGDIIESYVSVAVTKY